MPCLQNIGKVDIERYIKTDHNGSDNLHNLLTRGMKELWLRKPADPVSFLAHYLLDNCPNTPHVTQPDEFKVSEALPEKDIEVYCVTGSPETEINLQADILAKDRGLCVINIDELLKKVLQNTETEASFRLRQYVESGLEIPDDYLLNIIKNIIKMKCAEDNEVKLVLQNFPRNINQAILFEKNVCPISKIIFLQLDEETIRKKLETKQIPENKIDQIIIEARENFTPLIDYYNTFEKLIFENAANKKQIDIWAFIEQKTH